MPDRSLIEYLIDAQNRRVGKKVNGSIVKRWLFEGQLHPIAELDSIGNVSASYVYGSRVDVPDYIVKASMKLRVITDHLGSMRLIVNQENGEFARKVDYDEFGNLIEDTNSELTPFGFAGGFYDNHTRLTRFGARDYDAQTSRWFVKDPIRFVGGDANLYNYVQNDPINSKDPSGLQGGPQQVLTREYYVRRLIEVIGSGITALSGTPDAISELWKAYQEMVAANTIGADKYFHCLGSCRASRKSSPKIVACLVFLREVYDNTANRVRGKRTPIEQAFDSVEDMAANRTGYNAPSNISCEKACEKHKVAGL
jgi:RHS repeat-associated protein